MYSSFNHVLSPWLSRGLLDGCNGGIVSASHDRTPVLDFRVGFASPQQDQPMMMDYRYNIASQTKTVTAIACMQQIAKGKIALEDKAIRYIPSLSRGSKDYGKITIEHLIIHSSGIRRDMPNNDYWEGTIPFPDEQDLLSAIEDEPLVFQPGQRMKYSNLGYALLGKIISEVSGTQYQEYVDKNIIKPLGLISMSFSHSLDNFRTSQGFGYQPAAKNSFSGFDSRAFAPAAGLWSSASDVRQLFEIFLESSDQQRRSIGLTEAAINQMLESRITARHSGNVEYGLGIDIGYDDAATIIGHGGGSLGYRSGTVVDRQAGLVVSTFANETMHDAFADAMSITRALRFVLNSMDNGRPWSVAPKEVMLFNNAWGTKQIIYLDDYLIATNPSSSDLFSDTSIEIAQRIGDSLFRIVQANSFSSDGEIIDFSHLDKGKISYAGRTMWVET